MEPLLRIEVKAREIANWKRGPKKDKALEFYRGAVGELLAFKDENRNYIMHDRFDYDYHKAASVYHRVGGFMQRMSICLSENKKGSISWGKIP